MDTKVALLVFCLPLALTQDALQQFTTGNNLFASEVYTQLAGSEGGNFLLSPLSAETVLALTYFGTRGASAQELTTALHLPEDTQLRSAARSLQSVIRSNDEYTLATANKVYVKNTFQITDAFENIALGDFGADVENIDFSLDSIAAGTINKWVEGRTRGKITDLVSPLDLSKNTRTVIVNALFFSGNWLAPFDHSLTSKQNFFRRGTDPVDVDTMHVTAHLNYHQSAGLKARFIELPFVGGNVTFTIVLPDEQTGLGELEKNIGNVLKTPEYFQAEVSLDLPKFKLESKLNLNDVLRQLGVSKIFKDDEADLSGLAGDKGDLVVGKVLQKVFVDVNEDGVEAGAATSVDVVVPRRAPDVPTVFIVDHPFIFYIKVQNLVVFAGRVLDPKL